MKTIVVPPANVYVNNRTEQKPHDSADAARLYGELRSKAEKEVANSVIEKLGANNEIVVVRVDSYHNYLTNELNARVLFKVNGYQYDMTCKVGEDFRRKAIEVLAEELTSSAIRAMERMK